MAFGNIYVISGIIFALIIILFILSKVIGCGIKLIKFAIIAAIIGLAVYGISSVTGG